MYDLVALGELLIDFTPAGKSQQGHPLFEENPGGAPCNVLAMGAKLGLKTAFLGKVGCDNFGRNLKETVSSLGIETKGLLLDETVNTTLAFVHLDEQGDRSFTFCRKPGADQMLRPDELDEGILKECRIFHFGTISMTDEPSRSATRRAIELVEASGGLRSFDPNLRMNLWDKKESAREQMEYGLGHCDILKISEEELDFITGTTDPVKGSGMLWEKFGIKLIFVTLGKDGSFFRYGETVGNQSGIPADTIDTTGAGDTFCGCVLSRILKYGWDNLTKEALEEALLFANAGASLVTERKGALKAMPSLQEIQARMGR